MSKSLRSIHNRTERRRVIQRRITRGLASKVYGLGFWAAVDGQKREAEFDKWQAKEPEPEAA